MEKICKDQNCYDLIIQMMHVKPSKVLVDRILKKEESEEKIVEKVIGRLTERLCSALCFVFSIVFLQLKYCYNLLSMSCQD